jgi:NAD(P)-dependent dehydrogenase (short-subunit alcohol dehydrogenase family)
MRSALVTGSTKGIGLELARQLAERGFRVWLSGRNEDVGKKAARLLAEAGATAGFVPMDIADPASIRKAYEVISSDCKQLDVLVNNAAVQPDSSMSILEVPPDVGYEILHINVLGAIFVTQVFSPLLRKGSRVINISSVGGQLTTGMGDWAPIYCISKTALNAVTVQFAKTLKSKGVAVNSVSPGWVRTDMGGPEAPRSVEQGAETPVWLATEASIEYTGMHWQDKKVIAW